MIMNDTAVVEEVIGFRCASARLWGILTRPAPDVVASATAVLIVVGGPQYRVGSHRQFVLLARALAKAGFATMRFDCTGMGDSEGDPRSFDALGPDLRAALDALSRACPDTQRTVVWGLCDGASAALLFATNDPRVAGIVAANPWARSEVTLAAARVKHYYATRILQREFWRKLLRGGLHWRATLSSLVSNVRGARLLRGQGLAAEGDDPSFQAAMARGLARFQGRMLLILSGNDLTAKEFLEYAESSGAWTGLLHGPKVSRFDLADSDHTFSRRQWLEVVESETVAWLSALDESYHGAAAVKPRKERT